MQSGNRHCLSVLPGRLAIARLGPEEPLPAWIGGGFFSVTRTGNELSVVCEQRLVPDHVEFEPDWAALEVAGPLAFSQTGVIASLVRPLATAGLSVFVISTFDTDYLLIKRGRLAEAEAILVAAGHRFSSAG